MAENLGRYLIRDPKLAFALHSALVSKGFVVGREWQHVDIGILCERKPVALIELKAMYTFDAFSQKDQYAGLLQGDVTKCHKICRRLGVQDTEVFTLLLATHPSRDPEMTLSGIVKYDRGIRNALREHETYEQVLVNAQAKIQGWPGEPAAGDGEIDGGMAFGIPVSIHYWVFGPHDPKSEPAVV